MDLEKGSPSPARTGTGSIEQLPLLRTRRILSRGSKRRRILERLIRGERLHCLTPDLHDSCLHSTIAQLERFDLRIERKWIMAYGYNRARTHVCEYWLAENEAEKARALLD
jgi:hypothetical protein